MALFERLAVDWLKGASQKAVSERLGLSQNGIHGIMERAVERGLARRKAEPVPRLGVDEKALRKGRRYFTLVNDVQRSRVFYVAEDRTQASLDGFWKKLTREQVESIEAIAMDCGIPTWPRCRNTCPRLRRRLCFTSFTSPSTWVTRWIACAAERTRRCSQRAMTGSQEPATTGSATRPASSRKIARSSRH